MYAPSSAYAWLTSKLLSASSALGTLTGAEASPKSTCAVQTSAPGSGPERWYGFSTESSRWRVGLALTL